MTQFELAFVVNIAERSLSAIETGKVFPNSLILFRIANAFGMSVSELINF
ncbi:MAG: helix-turn-helix transcriptional regulator [Clostridium sp.]|nr:MAG: helix-turn-helix transcriptional regulator [Clostridium sp.]